MSLRLRTITGAVVLVIVAALVAGLLTTIRSNVLSRDRALTLAETALGDLQETREAFRDERRQLNAQIDSLLAEVDRLNSQIDELTSKASDLQTEVARLLGEVERLRQQVVNLGGEVDDLDVAMAPVERIVVAAPRVEPQHPGCAHGQGKKDC